MNMVRGKGGTGWYEQAILGGSLNERTQVEGSGQQEGRRVKDLEVNKGWCTQAATLGPRELEA